MCMQEVPQEYSSSYCYCSSLYQHNTTVRHQQNSTTITCLFVRQLQLLWLSGSCPVWCKLFSQCGARVLHLFQMHCSVCNCTCSWPSYTAAQCYCTLASLSHTVQRRLIHCILLLHCHYNATALLHCYSAVLKTPGYPTMGPYCINESNTSQGIIYGAMYGIVLLIVLVGTLCVLSIIYTAWSVRRE
jgi:hypothetical protein